MKIEKMKKNLGIIKKNCVTKKEVRVGNAKIKSHCTYGKSTCWSSGNAISPLLSHPPGPEFQPFASPSNCHYGSTQRRLASSGSRCRTNKVINKQRDGRGRDDMDN